MIVYEVVTNCSSENKQFHGLVIDLLMSVFGIVSGGSYCSILLMCSTMLNCVVLDRRLQW